MIRDPRPERECLGEGRPVASPDRSTSRRRVLMPPPAEAPGRTRLPLAAAGAIAAGLLVATFPAAPAVLSATIDGSWVWEINRLPASGFVFGRDVAYTYGPLGYLLHPLDMGPNLWRGALLRFANQLAVAALIAVLLARARSLVAVAVFVASQLWAAALGLTFEYQILLTVPLLAAESLLGASLVGVAAVALLASGMLFIKASLGLGALAACLLMVLLWARRGPRALLATGIAAAFYGIGLLALSVATLGSVGHAPRWVRDALSIAGAYSEAMGTSGSTAELWLGAAAAVGYAGVAAWLASRAGGGAALALLFLMPVFLSFKHAFTRQDFGHLVSYFPFITVVAGLLALRARDRRELATTGGLAVAAAALGAWLAGSHGVATTTMLRGASQGPRNLADWVDIRRQRAHGPPDLVMNRFPDLPRAVAGRAVGVVPYLLTDCAENGLRCVPNPTLQTYLAYTAALDRRTAEHYGAVTAPDVVLAQFAAIDGHHLVLETPATWQALLAHYRPARDQPAPGRLLLERKPQAMDSRARDLGPGWAHPGAWTAAPHLDGGLIAHLDFELTPWGRVVKTLFRIPPIYLDLLFCSGRAASYRIVPDTARNGLPLWAVAPNLDGLAAAAAGHPRERVVKIAVHGSGLAYYRTPIPLRWTEAAVDASAVACMRPRPEPLSSMRPLPSPPGAPLFSLDGIGEVGEPARGSRAVVSGGAPVVMFHGWAVDPVARRGASAVSVTWEGGELRLECNQERSDVAAVFGVPGFASGGFDGVVPASALGRGRHELHFAVVSADGTGYYRVPGVVTLTVE